MSKTESEVSTDQQQHADIMTLICVCLGRQLPDNISTNFVDHTTSK